MYLGLVCLVLIALEDPSLVSGTASSWPVPVISFLHCEQQETTLENRTLLVLSSTHTEALLVVGCEGGCLSFRLSYPLCRRYA